MSKLRSSSLLLLKRMSSSPPPRRRRRRQQLHWQEILSFSFWNDIGQEFIKSFTGISSREQTSLERVSLISNRAAEFCFGNERTPHDHMVGSCWFVVRRVGLWFGSISMFLPAKSRSRFLLPISSRQIDESISIVVTANGGSAGYL